MKFWDSSKSFKLHLDNMDIHMAEHTKFLGIYIDCKLNWHIHMSHLLDKLYTNRCLMNLGKNVLDLTCLRNIYFGHIHSHIQYGVSVWGSMISQSMINEIYKIQKKCIHLMRPQGQWRDVSLIFDELCVMPVQSMVKFALCKLGHNVSHRVYPTPIIEQFNRYGGLKTHHYPTRNKHIPNLQRGYSEQYRTSFLCTSILEYNSLPGSLKHIASSSVFICRLKKYILTGTTT